MFLVTRSVKPNGVVLCISTYTHTDRDSKMLVIIHTHVDLCL